MITDKTINQLLTPANAVRRLLDYVYDNNLGLSITVHSQRLSIDGRTWIQISYPAHQADTMEKTLDKVF